MTTLASDSFAYTGTLNASNWTVEYLIANMPSAASGFVQGTTLSATNSAYWTGFSGGTFPNDQWAQLTLDTLTTAGEYLGVLLRGSTTTANNLRIYVSAPFSAATTVTIGKIVSGTFTSLTSGTFNIATGAVLYAQVIGNVITVNLNGSQILTYNNSAGDVLSGLPGLVLHTDATSVADVQGDSWSAGNFGGGAAIAWVV